jgi:nitrate/TMAO reductase-like tetraheme cytochrome c subunit
MAKISLAGFADPARRPRYIIWTGVAVLVFAAVMVTVLGVTSTRWFCAQGCHKVQDDTIVAYEHSSHSEISCMACHMPVNANPIIFLLHKAEALGELAQTVTNNYELPLNAESEVALTMKSEQCNQCHNIKNRIVTPSPGIKINHATHLDKGITCTICHNRIAHNEDFELQLKNPKTGEPNKKHFNFMSMTACFRCHGLEVGSPAPGTCSACHTPGFELKPPSHLEADFFPTKHGELAKESYAEVAATLKETSTTPVTVESKNEWKTNTDSNETLGQKLVPAGAVFYCGTCHKIQFCNDCHGTPMPHSEEFKNPKDATDPLGHPVVSTKIPDKCVMCHTKDDPNFCNKCHHGTELKFAYDPAVPWLTQHPKAVAAAKSVQPCLKCHLASFCSDCHTRNKVLPDSHKQAGWVHGTTLTVTQYGSQPATPSAGHALAAIESTETCAVCHGEGGTSAPFCANCHKTQTPHTDQFKTTPGVHATEGRKNPAVCENCHTWPELCSNCHHIGSSATQPWLTIHGGQVEQHGASTCPKCHPDKTFCQSCHQRNKVMPASHKLPNFLRQAPPNIGVHAQLYQKDATVCTNCHPGDPATLPSSAFCMGCHKLIMPHPAGWGLKDSSAPPSGTNGGQHVQDLASGKTTTAVCTNCHDVAFCDSCHHKNGYVANQSWLVKTHPAVVQKSGATSCYDSKNGGTTGCHAEAFCSDCHVNRAAQLKKSGGAGFTL